MMPEFTRDETFKVKGIAIMMLLFHHLYYERTALNSVVDFSDKMRDFSASMRLCVWIFLFLSAYGLAKRMMTRKEGETDSLFVLKHFFNLMKAFWFIYAGVLICYLLPLGWPKVSMIYGQKIDYAILYGIINFMGGFSLFGTPTLNMTWWYMSLAVLLVAVFPLLFAFIKRFSWLSLPLCFVFVLFVPGFYGVGGGRYQDYLPVVVLAILCAQNGSLERCAEKIKQSPRYGRFFLFCATVGCAGGLLAVTTSLYNHNCCIVLNTWIVALQSFLIALLSLCFCGGVPGLILGFLGRHFGNIFMIHTLIYCYYPRFIYGSGSVILSFLILLGTSLAISILIEYAKKWTGYNRAMSGVGGKIA